MCTSKHPCTHKTLPSYFNTQVDETLDMSEDRQPEPTDGSEYKVWGNLVAFVERLDDEMFKSLQVSVQIKWTIRSICSVLQSGATWLRLWNAWMMRCSRAHR